MSALVGRAAQGVEALGRRRRGVVGALLVAAVALLAVLYTQPWSTTTYDLHDSGIWVTNDDRGLVGRLNAQIPEIDFAREGSRVEIVQDGRSVFLVAATGDATTVSQLDGADPSAEPTEVALEEDAAVLGGGGVLAALVGGDVTIIGTDGALGGGGATFEVGDEGLLAVGVDGTVAGWAPDSGQVEVLEPGADEPRTVDLEAPDGAAREDLSLALVGTQPVGLDSSGDAPRLLLPGEGPVALGEHGATAALQRSGPDTGQVLVATDRALLAVGLGDGEIEVVADDVDGEPARPAVDDEGCRFGAWRGPSGALVVACDDADPLRSDDVDAGPTAVLRTGGPQVVLNDPDSGVVHVVVDGAIERVETWPEEEDVPVEADTYEQDPPNPEDNVAPEATPDVGGPEAEGVGARPGRITFLPLLRNDTDENGDILAIDPELELDDTFEGIVSVAHDGRSVAVDLTAWPEDESGTVSFRYVATDGEMKSEPVEVEVEVVTDPAGHDPSVIEAHELDLQVASGQRVEQDVMSVFWDYDGDPLYLAGATAPADGGHRVTWEPDGRVAFAAGEPGVVPVALAVLDITGRSAPAKDLEVMVETPDAGTLLIDLNNDIVAGQVGTPLAIDPLDNDVNPTGGELSLADVPTVLRGEEAGLGKVQVVGGEVRFEPVEPGDYVLLYRVEQAEEDVRATVLVRVTTDEPLAPSVRPDVVVVEEGQWAEADLLANDVDPNGELVAVSDLVPTEVRADEEVSLEALGTLLSASVLADYRTLRADLLPEARPGTYITYTYVASDGRMSSSTTVTVVVVPAASNRPPETRRAEVVVRAGDAVVVPLADFASDPDGDPLEVAVVGQPEVGDAAPNGETVRFFAPADAGDRQVSVLAEVTEPVGNPQTAQIDVTIVGPDPDTPPRAEDLEARVRAGETVIVPVPLIGLDPDGDDVRLLGRTDAIGFDGEVVEDHQNQAFRVETARSAPGSQTVLRYKVIDARGRESAEARIRIVVTPRADKGRPPVAMIDRLTARTSDEVFIDPVANDTDLDGDLVTLSPVLGRDGAEDLDPVLVETGDCEAEATDEGLVRIATGEEDCTITYATVDVEGEGGDVLGLPQEGQIVVSTVGEGFAGIRPQALDDYGTPEARAPAVEVDVLRNDGDRDGDPSALAVTLVDAGGEAQRELEGAALDPDSGLLTVALAEEARIVRYRITDGDDLTADAAVRVPGLSENRPPELREGIDPVEIAADDEGVTVDLGDYVVDPDGDAVTYLDVAGSGQLDSAKLRIGFDDGEIVVDAPDRNTSGPATVQVVAADDEASASLAIPVEITAGENQPPSWAGDPCGEVVRLEPLRVPLRADDPDPGDTEELTFDIAGAATKEGVSVTVSGASLVVETTTDATPNQTVEFTLTVDDGEVAEPVPQPCVIRVKRSNLPPLRANPTSMKVEQGKTVSIPLGDLVVNARGDVSIETLAPQPASAGQVSGSGSTIQFQAGEDAKGAATIRYEVSDEADTEGERRRATGLVELQIVGRPEAPAGVGATQSGDDGVSVSWAAGDDNGAPIEHFVVDGSPGGSKQCDRSPCTLTTGDGIEVDGNDYSFTVTAVNEVGTSEPSGASSAVKLDQPPSAPRAPKATPLGPGDGALRRVELSWSPGEQKGSAVTGWLLGGDLSGEPNPLPAGQTSVTREVLADGGRLTVQAVNGRGESEPITIEVSGSYGTPQVTDLTVTPLDEGKPTANVTWTADANGGSIKSQTVTADGCQVEGGINPAGTKITCNSRNSRDVTVAVVNDHDVRGTASRPSGDLLARPVVSAIGLTPGDKSISVDVDFDDGGGGATGGTFTLTGPSGSKSGTLDSSGNGSVTGLTAWEDYTVTAVQVCRGPICSEGPPPSHASAMPYTAPANPVITKAERVVAAGAVPTGAIDVVFTWDGGGSPLPYTYAVAVTGTDGASGVPVDGENPTQPSGNVLEQTYQLTVTVTITDEAGRKGSATTTIDAIGGDLCELLPAAPDCEEPEPEVPEVPEPPAGVPRSGGTSVPAVPEVPEGGRRRETSVPLAPPPPTIPATTSATATTTTTRETDGP